MCFWPKKIGDQGQAQWDFSFIPRHAFQELGGKVFFGADLGGNVGENFDYNNRSEVTGVGKDKGGLTV